MKNTIDLYDDNLKKNILNSYNEGNSVNEIVNKYYLTFNEVVAILYSLGITFNGKREELCEYKLNDKKYFIISDTHLGSRYDNLIYLDKMYDYAKNKGVTSIIHLGDLMQSSISGVKEKLINPLKQLEYVLNNYPSDDYINNYVLLGNHDFHLLSKDDSYYNYLCSREDFKILGYNYDYIKLNDMLFSLFHSIEHYRLSIPSFKGMLDFKGHRHEFKIKGNSIFIPSLSDDLKNYDKSTNNLAGFLELNIDGDCVELYHYVIGMVLRNIGQGVEIFNNGLVLKKKNYKKW